MKTINIPVKIFIIIGILIIISISTYLIFEKLTSPYGIQKVEFVTSESESFVIGKLTYTIYKPLSGVNGDIIYHLHGRNLDGSIWSDDTYFTSMIQSYWQKTNIIPPTIVVISYGSEWLLTPKNSTEKSGLMEDFITNLPLIESKIGIPNNRILLGESMGGLNVLILGLSHPNLFSKIASLWPGVYLDSPFSEYEKIHNALIRTGGDPKIAFGIYLLSKRYVSNEAEWQKISPISLISQANDNYPELYLSCGLYDKYGNFEGTEALVNIAKLKGVKTHWRPLYGGHGATDIVSLANFLISN